MEKEKIVYRGLDQVKPIRPLNDEENSEYRQLLSIKKERDSCRKFTHSKVDEFKSKMRSTNAAKILMGKIEMKGLTWDDVVEIELLMLIDILDDGIFNGDKIDQKSVMWAYTLLLWSVELGRPVTINDFRETYYPRGVPAEVALVNAWSDQKEKVTKIPSWGKYKDSTEMSALWMPLIQERKKQLNKT